MKIIPFDERKPRLPNIFRFSWKKKDEDKLMENILGKDAVEKGWNRNYSYTIERDENEEEIVHHSSGPS